MQIIQPERVVEFFLAAYREGAFPMAEGPGPAGDVKGVGSRIGWYSPDPRAILPLDAVHVPRTLRRLLRRPPFEFTSDACFERVIRACAEVRPAKPGGPESLPWLNEGLIRAYTLLHAAGRAHSVEAWLPAEEGREERVLVGGIYGVQIGAAFFAESMFCRPGLGGTNASNLCLLKLVEHVRAHGFTLLDVQMANEHTERFGVVEISRATYLRRLKRAVDRDAKWEPFDAARRAPA